jgi:(p)ppGpp synthase/HD superfamily hydrolase
MNETNILRAKNLATEAHAGQFRKNSGIPYITHPERVANKVREWATINRADPEILIKAAWTHDVLEDCPQISKEQFIHATDQATYDLVLELTNPSKGSNAPRAVRKQMDRDHLKNVSFHAKIIKLIDRIENLKDTLNEMNESNFKFAQLYASESRLLLDCIKDADEGLANELLSLIEKIENAKIGS